MSARHSITRQTANENYVKVQHYNGPTVTSRPVYEGGRPQSPLPNWPPPNTQENTPSEPSPVPGKLAIGPPTAAARPTTKDTGNQAMEVLTSPFVSAWSGIVSTLGGGTTARRSKRTSKTTTPAGPAVAATTSAFEALGPRDQPSPTPRRSKRLSKTATPTGPAVAATASAFEALNTPNKQGTLQKSSGLVAMIRAQPPWLQCLAQAVFCVQLD